MSALLAVLMSVPEFSRAILGPLGAPNRAVQAWIEVTFDVRGERFRPDAVIKVVRGRKEWSALVEVKTGANPLEADQLEAYLDVARERGMDAVLTISNQMVAAVGEHPTQVDRKKLKKVGLHHLSWSQIHTEAVVERVNRSVPDPDQARLLTELIRYLEHPNSGAVDFEDMGQHWPTLRDAAAEGSLRATDKGVVELVGRFAQLVSFAGMRLSRSLGVDVRPVFSRADLQDIGLRTQQGVTRLVDHGPLQGSLLIPHAAATLQVSADLRAGRIDCSAIIDAPRTGQQATRVRWLVRQLGSASDDLLIEATAVRTRGPGPCFALREVREDPKILIADPTRELRSFTLRLSARAGTKRSAGRGSFVDSVLELVDAFYVQVLQGLKAWREAAPSVKPEQELRLDGVADVAIANELPAQPTPRDSTGPDPAVLRPVEPEEEVALDLEDGPQS